MSMQVLSIDQMPLVRIIFSKTGRAKYTSHLDTMRTMSRAFKRSGLPVWYTQGFNPHMYINFALPIALGYESICESMDIRLTEEIPLSEVVDKLNKALPPGFEAVSAAAPASDPKEITWADYTVRLIYHDTKTDAVVAKLDAFLKLPVIEVVKKSKKGEKTVDIKPLSQVLSIKEEQPAVYLNLRMASGITVNINPTLLLKAFYSFCDFEPDGVKITRTAILGESLQPFR